ncbi:MAG: hydroxyacylglutathione hydrolase, partial [Bdellovibrionales bacterium]
ELQKRDLHLALILNTHHHPDHTGGNVKLQAEYGAPVIGPAKEEHKIDGLSRGVDDGETITFSDLRGQVIETPGHTSGSISFYFPSIQALFAGDTLFSLGCGRLFEGNAAEMWASLTKLRALPDETRLYAGHEYTERNLPFAVKLDPQNPELHTRAKEVLFARKKGEATLPSLLGQEKKINPFLRVDDPEFQKTLEQVNIPSDANPAAIFGALRAAKDRFTMPISGDGRESVLP